MCGECAILREHYPRDPEVRLVRVRLFFPSCIYCGARYIQWIQRKSGRPAEARKRECRRVLERWKAHYHDEAELRALAKSPTWAVEPAPDAIAAGKARRGDVAGVEIYAEAV